VTFLDFPWGLWNGLTAWIVLIVHVFGGWQEFPVFDLARSSNWYDFGFLVGAGSPLLGAAGAGARSPTAAPTETQRTYTSRPARESRRA
jgi:hypothetical protein